MSLQAVILAGGIGKRIAPLGVNRPKAMFEIMGKPLVQHVLAMVRAADVGIDDVVLVIGPGDSLIQAHLGTGDALGMRLRYVVQEQPLGQANALLTARELVRGNFLVLNANDVFDPALIADLSCLGNGSSLDVGLVGRPVDNPNKFGVMAFDVGGRLAGVVEKPPAGQEPSNTAVVGLYYFSPNIWAALDDTPLAESDDQLERAYGKLISEGGGGYVRYDGPFASYKYPWDLLAINDLILRRSATRRISETANISPLAVVDGAVVIEDGVRVLEHAVIRGPAYIGRNTIIGNSSLLRGGTSVGQNCVVGFGTEISHSILGNDCWTHKNFIGDSIVSDNCSFGAGTITANLRFDERLVEVRVGDERVSSGTEHFGMIMAEDCRTGCNAVILPGVKIGPNSVVGAGVVLKSDLPPGQAALLRSDAYAVRPNRSDISSLSRKERMKKLKR